MRSRDQILDEIVADIRDLIAKQSDFTTAQLASAAAGGAAHMLIRSGAPGTEPFSGEHILKLAAVLMHLLRELEFAQEGEEKQLTIPDVLALDVSKLDTCPICGVSWVGDPIPETHRQHYGGATHFRRLIAMYDVTLDCTTQWKCPDCLTLWDRDKRVVDAVKDRDDD